MDIFLSWRTCSKVKLWCFIYKFAANQGNRHAPHHDNRPQTKVLKIAEQAVQSNEKVQVEYALLEDAIPIALAAESKGAQVIINRVLLVRFYCI